MTALRLLDMLAPHWSDKARCQGEPTDVFFPETPGRLTYSEAKAICALCPVRAECLEYALDTNTEHGVFGGMTSAERARIRRATGRQRVRNERPRKTA